MLGHASATQTLDRYAALWPDELDAVADRIDLARESADLPSTVGPRGRVQTMNGSRIDMPRRR